MSTDSPTVKDNFAIQGLEQFLQPISTTPNQGRSDVDSIQELNDVPDIEYSFEEIRLRFYLEHRPWLSTVEARRKQFDLANGLDFELSEQELSPEECRWAYIVMHNQLNDSRSAEVDKSAGYLDMVPKRNDSDDDGTFDVSPEECRYAYYQMSDVKLLRPSEPLSSSSQIHFIEADSSSVASNREILMDSQVADVANGQVSASSDPAKYRADITHNSNYDSVARRSLIKSSLDYIVLLYAMLGLSVAECVLVSFPGSRLDMFVGQVVILALSTMAFVVDIAYVASRMINLHGQITSECVEYSEVKISVANDESLFNFEHALDHELTARNILEFSFLSFGWITLFLLPEIAALRCFRLFCCIGKLSCMWNDSIVGDARPSTLAAIISIFHNISNYLCLLCNEVFSSKGRGGVGIFVLFFFSAYIMAVVFLRLEDRWLDLDGLENSCGATVRDCFSTMLRINLMDSEGLSYIASVIQRGHGWMAVLLIGYMCFTGLVLISGLIGVFGVSLFSGDRATQSSVNDEIKITSEIGKVASAVQSLREQTDYLNVQQRLTKIELQLERLTRLLQLMRHENEKFYSSE